jgi:hypothetical protein
MNNTETLKEILIEGYNDAQLNKECKGWFPTYNEKCAYILGRSKAMDGEVLTDELANELVGRL